MGEANGAAMAARHGCGSDRGPTIGLGRGYGWGPVPPSERMSTERGRFARSPLPGVRDPAPPSPPDRPRAAVARRRRRQSDPRLRSGPRGDGSRARTTSPRSRPVAVRYPRGGTPGRTVAPTGQRPFAPAPVTGEPCADPAGRGGGPDAERRSGPPHSQGAAAGLSHHRSQANDGVRRTADLRERLAPGSPAHGGRDGGIAVSRLGRGSGVDGASGEGASGHRQAPATAERTGRSWIAAVRAAAPRRSGPVRPAPAGPATGATGLTVPRWGTRRADAIAKRSRPRMGAARGRVRRMQGKRSPAGRSAREAHARVWRARRRRLRERSERSRTKRSLGAGERGRELDGMDASMKDR